MIYPNSHSAGEIPAIFLTGETKMTPQEKIKKGAELIQEGLAESKEPPKPKFEIEKPGDGDEYLNVRGDGVPNVFYNEVSWDERCINSYNYEIGPGKDERTKTRAKRERATRLLYKAADVINKELGEFDESMGQ